MSEKDRRETVALVLDLRHSVDCTCKLLQINRPIAKVLYLVMKLSRRASAQPNAQLLTQLYLVAWLTDN